MAKLRIDELNLQVKTKKSCLLRCQQAFTLSLIGFGIVVFVLILTTPLPMIIESWVSNINSTSSPPTLAAEKPLFNLMEEKTFGELKSLENFNQSLCTFDYVNENKLQQDHPCLIRLIREYNFKYQRSLQMNNYSFPFVKDGRLKPLHRGTTCLLRSQSNFIECGVLDDDRSLFNKLFMKRMLNWRGLPIKRNSKIHSSSDVWTLPVCLSLKPYPTEVFIKLEVTGGHNSTETKKGAKVQCFPLYSILLATERTQTDYFNLEVSGHEFEILQTIPWHKVDIKTLAFEKDNDTKKQSTTNDYMTSNGYFNFGYVSVYETYLIVFVQDFLKYWRPN